MDEVADGPQFFETHVSWVLLTGSRAFKIAKPLRTDVVDQSDVDRRRAACEREVELNRRLAPDVYLGVGSICLEGEELEPVVVMERMPADRRLTDLLDGSDAEERIRAVARTIATFHAATPPLDRARAERVASAAALTERWREDVAGMRSLSHEGNAGLVDRIEALAMRYLDGREALFEQRIERGFVRDGHGDLLADDIFCLDDGPRILDCLAFSDDLRQGDVVADLAFLVMDLQRLGHPDLARRLLRDYTEFSDEHHPGSLAHFSVAQRALVRAKVTALRDAQRHGRSEAVDDLLRLALDHLRRATPRVVLVGGIPGSGKSTVSDRLADSMGWAVLSSDAIRRDLGLRDQDGGEGGGYGASPVAAVYRELRRRASRLVSQGISVVLDASWSSAEERAEARAMASTRSAEIVEMRCGAPVDLCRRRVAGRSEASLSEATPAVVDLLAAQADPWPEAVVVPTGDVGGPEVVEALAVSAELWWPASALVRSGAGPARS